MITRVLSRLEGVYAISEVRVIDGDTIEAVIHLPFLVKLQKRIRLKGWWADELKGLYSESGLAAKQRLEAWCADKALWIASPSGRCDKYGRVVAHLVHGHKLVNPAEVLGSLSLTAAQHTARSDQKRHLAALGQKPA